MFKKISLGFLTVALCASMVVANPIISKASETDTNNTSDLDTTDTTDITEATVDAGYTYTVKIHLAGTGSENYEFDKLETIMNSGYLQVVRDSSESGNVSATIEDDVLTITCLEYGDQVVFDPQLSLVKSKDEDDSELDSKYYVMGIRAAGSDDNTSKATIDVTKDSDYVIAYGVGEVVAYTVNYVDAYGNKIADSVTYYGPKGQSIYVSYRYIEGYVPNTYNYYTSALKDDAEFTFTYYQGTYQTTNTEYVTTTSTVTGGSSTVFRTVPGATTVAGGGAAAAGGDGGVAAGNGNAAGGDANGADGDNAVIEDEATPTAPEDVIDIDDEDVALAGGAAEEYVIPVVAIVIILVAIAAIIAVVLVNNKRKKIAVASGDTKKNDLVDKE